MGPTAARHISHFYEIISAFVCFRRVSGQTEPLWMLLFVLSFHFIISLQPSLNLSEFGFLFRFNILSLFRFSLMKSAKWIFLSELISLSDFFQLRLWLIPSLMLIVSMQTILYELWVTTMQINSKIGNERKVLTAQTSVRVFEILTINPLVAPEHEFWLTERKILAFGSWKCENGNERFAVSTQRIKEYSGF